MSDLFLRLSQSPAASAVVRGLGLPLPQPLKRMRGPHVEQPLSGRVVMLGNGDGAALAEHLSPMLTRMGATLRTATELGATERPHALVFDATGLDSPDALDALYAFFHANLRALDKCGRVIVLVRPPADSTSAAGRAARRAVEGFVRSLAKELGRKGATAQTLHVATGAEDRVEPVMRFLLSPAAAYVSGQTMHLGTTAPYAAPASYAQSLKGKVALVTGSARGIGEATARTLAREGAMVIVMDRPADFDAAQAVASAIGGSALGCDITEVDAAEKIRQHLAAQHGGQLDILVHNAGITRDKMLVNMGEDRWNAVLEVNLRALIRLNEALLGDLRDGGRIICLSSIGGIAGNVGQTNYAATKAGVIGYIEGLAPQLAPRGITVNAIAPGFIETRMTAAIPLATREVARRLSNVSQGGLPEDVAETLCFLSTPGACALSGQVLRVCGGNLVGR